MATTRSILFGCLLWLSDCRLGVSWSLGSRIRRVTGLRQQQQYRIVTQAASSPWQASASSLSSSRLFLSNSPSDKHDDESKTTRRRAHISGVSLSESGFFVFLECSASAASSSNNNETRCNNILPIQVTCDPRDSLHATSPQALTLLQLLATPTPVDMAGPVFPVETLSKLVVLHHEEQSQDNTASPAQHPLVDYLQASIAVQLANRFNVTSDYSYSSQPDWIQARLSLPPCSVDQVQVTINNTNAALSWSLQVRSPSVSTSLSLAPSHSAVEQVCWRDDQQEYSDSVAMAFVCLALALRYKAPIDVVTATNNVDDNTTGFCNSKELLQQFPMAKSRTELSQTTTRVHKNIERGFNINKLQAALRVAMQKGDVGAATKIRRALDEMDDMSDLPVQAENDLTSME